MNCPYLSKSGYCNACLHNCAFQPTIFEKKNYCTNEDKMSFCPRLRLYQSHLEATNSKGSRVSNVSSNINTLTNASTTSLDLSLDLKEAFELAYAMVEVKKDITQDERDLINGQLSVLEKEVVKAPAKRDVDKIEQLRVGFEKYGWLIPFIIDITKKALGK